MLLFKGSGNSDLVDSNLANVSIRSLPRVDETLKNRYSLERCIRNCRGHKKHALEYLRQNLQVICYHLHNAICMENRLPSASKWNQVMAFLVAIVPDLQSYESELLSDQSIPCIFDRRDIKKGKCHKMTFWFTGVETPMTITISETYQTFVKRFIALSRIRNAIDNPTTSDRDLIGEIRSSFTYFRNFLLDSCYKTPDSQKDCDSFLREIKPDWFLDAV